MYRHTMHISTLLLALVVSSSALADDFTNTVKAQLLTPQFAKEFVGSYGILSDIEPQVSDPEQKLLTRLQVLFSESKFKDAENLLIAFIKETESPTDPAKTPGVISPAMVFVLGNLYFQAERYDEAKRAFDEAIKRFPRFRRAYTNLGYLYIAQSKVDDALKAFQKSVTLGENSPRVMGMLGYCYLSKQNPLAAENAYRQAYLVDPESRDWKLGMAQALLQQDKNAEAASIFGVLIKENQQDKQLWMRQTAAYLAMERKDEAILNLETLRLMKLADEGNLTLLGNLYMDQGQGKSALAAYSEAIALSPTLNLAQALKSAKILNDYGFPEDSAALITKIRSNGGKLSQEELIQLQLADLKVARSLNQSARVGDILASLIKDSPTNADVLLEMAKHYDLTSRDEPDEEKRKQLSGEAKTHYNLAMKSESTAYQANLSLGQLLVRESRTMDALPYLEKALALKKSESLEQYVSRVQRAAAREKLRKDREETDRAEAEKEAKKK
jgi:tetratricopeptide (TPR) repeat protein